MTAPSAASWRESIAEVVGEVWPTFPDGPTWIEAQVHVESLGDPRAVSACGAVGLLQLMPATAKELGVVDPFDPEENLRGGVTYLKRQYLAFQLRLPSGPDILRWSFAAYNCGAGYVKRALVLAATDDEKAWFAFEPNWRYLFHRSAAVNGHWADHRQVRDYVARIELHHRTLIAAAGVGEA